MLRRYLLIAALVALPLLCTGMWIRSLWTIDYLQWTDSRHFPAISSSGGRLIYTYQFWPGGAGGNDPGWSLGSRPLPDWPRYWERPDVDETSRHWLAGFEWSPAATSTAGLWADSMVFPTTRVIAVPYWFLTTILAALCAIALRRAWRAWRIRQGHCHSCGYDLRATPDRCPECGTHGAASADSSPATTR